MPRSSDGFIEATSNWRRAGGCARRAAASPRKSGIWTILKCGSRELTGRLPCSGCMHRA